jgi:hypothetical protein
LAQASQALLSNDADLCLVAAVHLVHPRQIHFHFIYQFPSFAAKLAIYPLMANHWPNVPPNLGHFIPNLREFCVEVVALFWCLKEQMWPLDGLIPFWPF